MGDQIKFTGILHVVVGFGGKDTFHIKVEVVVDEGVGAGTLHQIAKSRCRQSYSTTLVFRMDLLPTVNKHTQFVDQGFVFSLLTP